MPAFLALAVAVSLLALGPEPVVGSGTLRGRVMWGDTPVAGATIILTAEHLPATDIWPGGPTAPPADQVLTVRARGDGTFRIERLPARRWNVYVQHPGVLPHAGTVTVSQPPAETYFDLALQPAATVRGRVVDPFGRPGAGVTVRLSADAGSFFYPNPRTLTDRRGDFELAQSVVGKAWLEAYTSDGRMAADQIDVAAGKSVHNLNLAPADDPGTVRLRVIGNHGRPLGNAWIGVGPEVRTDAAGGWRTRRYSAAAPFPYLTVTWGGQFFPSPPVRFPQRPGAEIVLTIPDGIVDVDISSGDLWLNLRGPVEAHRAANPDPTTARFHLLPEGRFTLYAHHPDHRMGLLDVDLGAGESRRVQPPLDRPGRSVVGRFVGRKLPASRLDVQATCWTLPYPTSPDGKIRFDDTGLGSQTVRADADGRFTLVGLHPGRHVIAFEESFELRRAIFLIIPESGSGPIDIGIIKPTREPRESQLERLLVATQEGLVVEHPGRRPRLQEFKPGDLILDIDGLSGLKDWEAKALLEDPGPHRAVLRGSARSIIVRCPPAGPNVVLPTRLGFGFAGMGDAPALLVDQLGADHPWKNCLEPDDLLSAVMTDPRVVRTVNGQWREPLDKALASGQTEALEVRRRERPRHVQIKPLR